MAVPAYVTDLYTINDGSGTFTEPASATLGAITPADTDNFVQSTSCNSKTTGASGAPALAGLGIAASGAQSISSPNAFYAWVFVGGGGLIDTYANGGIRLIIGQDLSNYRYWYADGNEYFPYIGWQCIAIETDNAVVAATGSTGSPSATKTYFGVVFNCKINIGKGNPMAVDALRWGRTITITAGEAANYATFAGCAGTNDAINARWGQFAAIPGGYQLQGRLLLGVTGGTAVDFRDSNVNIVTAVSRKVAASFNAIEIQNASSRVDWDSIAWSALGTVSRGTFTVTDDADVNITGCSFTGLSTFSLKAATDVLSSIFRLCDTVTAPGSNLSGSQFLLPRVAADTSAVVWNANVDPDGKLNNCVFSKGANAHHAIEFGTSSPTTLTLRGIAFGTGFNASNGNNDSTLRFLRTSGTITVNLIGCSGNISYKKEAGATVSLVVDPVSLAVHVQDINTGSAIVGARVWVPVTSTAGGKPYNATVTITRSTTTATVAHTGHGMATNDWVWISGCTDPLYNGTFQITRTTDDAYTYVMAGTPATSPAAGSPKATFVVLNGVTNSSGDISASYSWLAAQPVNGRVRSATGAGPYYKTAPVTGTISTTSGLAVTVQMIPDA